MTVSRRTRAATVAALAATALLGGCSLPTLSDLPAPHAVSGPTYRVTADFDDALNLPAGAKVKLDGAVVGEVTGISTSDYVAHLTLAISRSDRLVAGTTAQVRFTTPLGEMYVALERPAHPGRGLLHDGSHLGRGQTSAAPTIEDAFGALSTLINGGGLTQVGSIIRDVNTALHDNTGPARDLLSRLTTLVTDLNAHRRDIDDALDSLNTLSRTLAGGDDVIDAALRTFPAAVSVLSEQTGRLRRLVTSVTTLSDVATDVLGRSTDALVADVRSSRTVLASLADVRGSFAHVLTGVTRFGDALVRSAPGDYLDADALVTLDFDHDAVLPPADRTESTRTRATRTATPGSGSGTARTVSPEAHTAAGVATALMGGGAL